MRLYAAIDLHSNNSVLVILDEEDRVVYERRHPNELPVILAQLAPHQRDIQAVAVESTYNWYWLGDGIWNILGMTIMYEAGDMSRFKKAGNFASYARCVGSSRWSNGKKKGEGNRKNGNKYLGWAFVEAAHYAIRYNERIRSFYQRKQARTNKIVAIKAVAHKLPRACYHVLKE